MTQTMTENRFKFWRILVALAHQDHEVTQEERDFIISKFDYIDFTETQKAQLEAELNEQQDAMALFDQLDNNEQRAECLHMAHTLFGSDNEFHPAEQAMYDHMKKKHMAGLDKDAIKSEFQKFREFQDIKNKQFESFLIEYKDEFDLLSGFSRAFNINIPENQSKEKLGFIASWKRFLELKLWEETSEDYFVVWRFIISLIHVDDKVTAEEKDMIMKRVESLNVNEDHRQQLIKDIDHPQDPVSSFDNIRMPMRRAECLYFAHIIFDSDMDYSPIERELYARLAETDDARTSLRDVYRKIDRREREKEDRSPTIRALQWLDDAIDPQY